MPAKGSCCCGGPADTHGLATMWLLDFNYGTVLRDFNWTKSFGGTPVSMACGFDEAVNRACEVGSDYVSGAPIEGSTFLWDATPPETPIWGPLDRTTFPQCVGGFTDSYFWYGHALPGITSGSDYSLAAVARSDGAQFTHGLTGGLLRVDGGYIYTYTQPTATHRKYDEAGSLIASAVVDPQSGSANKGLDYSGQSEHYSSLARGFPNNDVIYTATDVSSLATNWTMNLGFLSGLIQGNDGAGGLYLIYSAQLHKHSGGNTTPDWSISTASPIANIAVRRKFGWGGNIYYTRTISGGIYWEKLNGSDGSIGWTTLVPHSLASFLDSQWNIVYDGIVYLPYGTGIIAIDDASGAILWDQDTVVCGRARPVPTSLGLLCCGAYS